MPSLSGVNLVGHLESETGLGEAGRMVMSGLDACDVPLIPVDRPLAVHRKRSVQLDSRAACFPINLLCLNPPELVQFEEQAEPEFFRDRYSIGFWWWCAGPIPEGWRVGFTMLDEVWVGTEWVRRPVAAVSPVPVTTVKLPVRIPAASSRPRGALDLPEGFLFLSMFDYESSPGRKNPLGVVKAFRAAFSPGSGAALVIKSINGERHPAPRARLEEAVRGHPDVHVIDGFLPLEHKDALLSSCDCYVGLHRAEGFGLPIAEAMSLDKPAIATRYSGNLEFMTEENSYLADHSMTRVGDEGSSIYPPDAEWAEPDLAHAARLMRHVFENREEAGRRGRRGGEEVRRNHSTEAAGRSMRRRLEQLPPTRAEAMGGDDAVARLEATQLRQLEALATLSRELRRQDSSRTGERARLEVGSPPLRYRVGRALARAVRRLR